MGEKLAVTWQRFAEAPMSKIAKLVAQNYIGAGAEKVFYQTDDKELIVTIENWPNMGLLQALMMTKSMVDDFNYVFEPIAKFLGMSFEFASTENGYILKFKK